LCPFTRCIPCRAKSGGLEGKPAKSWLALLIGYPLQRRREELQQYNV
jgi:hypothetical protein